MNEAAFSYYKRLRRVQTYVTSHPGESLSLAKLAGIAGLEATYFSKFFRRKTGVGVHEWVNSVRVERAKVLIRQGNLSITRVAHEVGFPTLRTFERAFSRTLGITPRDYKKTVRPS